METATLVISFLLFILLLQVITLIPHLISLTRGNIKSRKNFHFQRRFQHAITGVGILVAMHIFHQNNLHLILLSAVTIVMTLIDYFRRNYIPFGKIVNQQFASVMRPEEVAERPMAAVYFVWGILTCFLLFNFEVASLATLYLSCGDPAAALVGIAIGGPKISSGKTVAGTIGCGCVCAIASILYFQTIKYSVESYLTVAFSGFFVGALAELTPVGPFFDDNVTIPWASSLLLTSLIHSGLVSF